MAPVVPLEYGPLKSAFPYWSRMWTFQEFFLPKNEPVCTMGGLQFRGTSMRDAGILLASSTEKATGWDVAMMTQAGIEFMEIQMIFDAWRELMERPNTLFIRPGQGDDEFDMTKLMLATNTRECTEPRDKVFALYGIVTEAAKVFPPDYSKSLDHVYLETTVFIINHEGHLPFLTFGIGRSHDDGERDAARPTGPQSPSWILDFSKTNPDYGVRTHSMFPERMEGFKDAVVSHDMTTLRFSGWSLGKVHLVLKFAATPSEVLDQLRDLLNNRASSNLSDKLPATTGITRLEFPDVARLCIDNDSRNHEPYTSEGVVRAFGSVLEPNKPPTTTAYSNLPTQNMLGPSNLEDLCRQGAEAITGMVLFTISTERGISGAQDGVLLGLADSRIKNGDVAVAAPQSGAPLVLRSVHQHPANLTDPPVDIENEYGHEHFKLVATARVDGLMENIAPNEELIESIRNRDLEDFFVC